MVDVYIQRHSQIVENATTIAKDLADASNGVPYHESSVSRCHNLTSTSGIGKGICTKLIASKGIRDVPVVGGPPA
jgi:hypothetical protein